MGDRERLERDLAAALISAAAALEVIAGEIARVAMRLKVEPDAQLNLTATLRGEIARKDRRLSTAQLAIATYVDAFRQRYGEQTTPDLRGKAQGILKRLAAEVPIERLQLLLQAYLQMEDRWFLVKCHDLVTFSENLGKVGIALDAGRANPSEKTWEDVLAKRGAPSAALNEGADGDQGTLQLTDR